MSPGPVVLPARFNANARSSPCPGVAQLAAHNRAQGGDEAGLPCHLPAPGEHDRSVTVRVWIAVVARSSP